jgi:O86/O127-antigen biosynthesis alpha-1,3-N-acetylgalactosaminyltransferase
MKNKSKILILVTDGHVGGVQSFLLQRFKWVCSDRLRVIATSDGRCCEEFRARGVDTRVVSKLQFMLLGFWLLRSSQNKYVICNSTFMGLAGRLFCAFRRQKVIYISHGWGVSYNSAGLKPLTYLMERWLSKVTHRIWCVSQRDFEFAINDLRIDPKKLSILNAEQFSYTAASPNVENICVVMRDAYPKRYDLVSLLAREFPTVKFHCFGADRPSSENILYYGIVDQVPYADFDAAMLLSDSEGYPMVAVEAARNGIPIFMLDLPINKQLEKNGILVKTLDRENLINSFGAFVSNNG